MQASERAGAETEPIQPLTDESHLPMEAQRRPAFGIVEKSPFTVMRRYSHVLRGAPASAQR